MALKDPANPNQPPTTCPPEILELLRQIGVVINNMTLYGPDHKMTGQSVEDTYQFLLTTLNKFPRINFGITKDKYLINGIPTTDIKNPMVQRFFERLTALHISGFSILKGMPKKEFLHLVEALGSHAATKGATEALSKRKLDFLKLDRAVYQLVSEKEKVIKANALHQKEAQPMPGKVAPIAKKISYNLGGDPAMPLPDIGKTAGTEAGPPRDAIGPIMAFIKGDTGVKAGDVSKDIQDIASDPEKLANLIMEAAVVRQKNVDIESGESLSDLIVGCLRRTYEGLTQSPLTRTGKGRQAAKKSLMLLEKSMLDKLHSLIGSVDSYAADDMVPSTEEPNNNAMMFELMRTEYARRKQDFQDTEQKIKKYVGMLTPEQLSQMEIMQKMKQTGVSFEGWQQLSVMGGQGGGGGGPEMPKEFAGFSLLLTQLETLMDTDQHDTKAAGAIVGQIGAEVSKITHDTDAKINTLNDDIRKELTLTIGDEKGNLKKLKKVVPHQLNLLKEIVQELCQPATAINCAVSIMMNRKAGEINDEQKELLKIMLDCGDKLTYLLDRLRSTVGVPDDLQPHKV